MLDLQGCLARLVEIAASDDEEALGLLDETVDLYLQTFGRDRAAQADGLYRLVAAFIGGMAPTRVSEAMTERLVERRGELLVEAPFAMPSLEGGSLRALIRRLGAVERTGTRLTPAELTLVLAALRFYRDAGPQG